jgi:hypothetical protein
MCIVHARACVYVCVHRCCAHGDVFVCVHMYVSTRACVYYACVCVSVCMHVCVHADVCMCVCVCVCSLPLGLQYFLKGFSGEDKNPVQVRARQPPSPSVCHWHWRRQGIPRMSHPKKQVLPQAREDLSD